MEILQFLALAVLVSFIVGLSAAALGLWVFNAFLHAHSDNYKEWKNRHVTTQKH